MHLAAAHGKGSALQAIIKTGVNIKAIDKRGWSILHHAAYHGRLNVLQASVIHFYMSISYIYSYFLYLKTEEFLSDSYAN